MKRMFALLALIQIAACGGIEEGIDTHTTEVRLPEHSTSDFYLVEVDVRYRSPQYVVMLDADALQVTLEGDRFVAYVDTYRVVGPALIAESDNTLRFEIDRRAKTTRFYLNGKRIAELAAAADLPSSMMVASKGSISPFAPREPRPPVFDSEGSDTLPEVNVPNPKTAGNATPVAFDSEGSDTLPEVNVPNPKTAGNATPAALDSEGSDTLPEVNVPNPKTAGNATPAALDDESDPAGALVNPPEPPVVQGGGSVALEGEDQLVRKPRPPVVSALRVFSAQGQELTQALDWSAGQ